MSQTAPTNTAAVTGNSAAFSLSPTALVNAAAAVQLQYSAGEQIGENTQRLLQAQGSIVEASSAPVLYTQPSPHSTAAERRPRRRSKHQRTHDSATGEPTEDGQSQEFEDEEESLLDPQSRPRRSRATISDASTGAADYDAEHYAARTLPRKHARNSVVWYSLLCSCAEKYFWLRYWLWYWLWR